MGKATVISPGITSDGTKTSTDDLLSITDTIPSHSDVYKSEFQGAIDGPGGEGFAVAGTDSIFNPFYIFRYAKYGAIGGDKYNFDYHKDINESSLATVLKPAREAGSLSPLQKIADQKKIAESPTASDILRWAESNAALSDDSTIVNATPYQWNDFLWCKWYGKIPNNRLLTLRRYPVPVEDNIQVAASKSPLVPIAQAVSWWGDETGNKISNVLDITYGWNWKDLPATKIQDVIGNELSAGVILDKLGITQANSPNTRKILQLFLFSNENNPQAATGFDKKAQDWVNGAYGTEGQYWNRVRGPINVINTTKIREQGFTYSHNISINFSYKLRTYANINPKIAMLDLISNFLSLTYNKADFWGGGIRYFQKTGFILPGIPTGKFEQADFPGGINDVLNYLVGQMQGKSKEVGEVVRDLVKQAKGDDAKLAGVVKTITGSRVMQNILGSQVSQLMQTPLTMRSLIDGRAVGEWHLTVGNPMNPLAVIGNLCMKNTTMSFSDALGIDDFPTEVNFKVTLEHGRPRAKQDIESMFNLGGGSMTFTALPQPSSSYNSYGERNSIVQNNLRRGRSDSTANSVADENYSQKTSTAAISETGTNPAEKRTTDVTVDNIPRTEDLSGYFRSRVSKAYGYRFGTSPVLSDYFQELKTKD